MASHQGHVSSASVVKTCLLLIDNQMAFDHPTHWGTERSTPHYKENLTALLGAARALDPRPLIIHVQHINNYNPDSLLNPSNPDAAADLYPFATPIGDEILVQKNKISAFVGTTLEKTLKDNNIQQLVICGLVTDGCVSTTTRMARDLAVTEFTDREMGSTKNGPIVLIEDACATFDKGGFDAETVHRVNVASLKDEFAMVMRTDQVLQKVFTRHSV